MATPIRKAPAGAKPSATTELNRLKLQNAKLERDNHDLQKRCERAESELRLTYRDIRRISLEKNAILDALDREKFPSIQATDSNIDIPF